MTSKTLRRLALVIFIATLSIGNTVGCNPIVSSQFIPTNTVTVTNILINEIQKQIQDKVEKFFELNKKNALNSSASKGLFSGEMTAWNTPTIGEIKGDAGPIIMLDSSNAIVRIQIESEHIFDVYLYLSFDSEWKFTAIRRMALPGFVRQTYLEYSKKAVLSPDEQNTFDEIKRLLMTDAEWQKFFLQNQSSFDALCAKSVKLLNISLVSKKNISTFPTIQQEFTALSVSTLEKEENGNIQIVMGGVIDNTVGFTCSQKNNPPEISASQYIWVEEIIDGWYLFRTT